jgi:hypothetical protein
VCSSDLLAWRQQLDADPAATIVELIGNSRNAVDARSLAHQVIQALGIDAWDMLDPNNAPPQENTELAAVRQELADLKRATSHFSERFTAADQQEQHYREQQELVHRQKAYEGQVIGQFAQQFPDYTAIENEMADHLTALQRTNPGLSLDAKLTRAYYAAKADAQKAALAKEQSRETGFVDAARKAASQNVRGTPVASSNQPTSVRAAQQAALAQARARGHASPSI